MKKINIYENRRSALTARHSRTLFVISSGIEALRYHSVRYRFKAASDFKYLSGLNLSDAILVLIGTKAYLLQKNNEDQVWGEHTSLTARDFKNLNTIVFDSYENLQQILFDLSDQYDRIALSFDLDKTIVRVVTESVSYKKRMGKLKDLCDSRILVGAIRAIKEANEIADLRQAGQRSSKVHELLMQQKLIGKSEREISNWIEAQFLLLNMQWTFYETIVGSGQRATLLHARATDQVVTQDDLVLVDAGAEWNGYCADITRTLPAGRSFTKEQKQIYEIVLQSQKQAIAAIKPGVTLKDIHETATQVLAEKLATSINIKKLMPHSTSHWIGLDVHDPCSYADDQGQDIKLKVGMCFTVEPGLYFNNIVGFEKYNGIGVRIEDDVVVTEIGCDLLTSVQKEVEEIEQLRSLSNDKAK